MDASEQAKIEGRKAGLSGVNPLRCPYSTQPLRNAWLDGWTIGTDKVRATHASDWRPVFESAAMGRGVEARRVKGRAEY